MPRIYASLAIATLTLFAFTAAFAVIDNGSAPDRHVLLGICTLLLSCFVQVLGFTYLTVTGKMIGQAANLANIDPTCQARVKQYKRSFTRQLALAIVCVVLASATGGASWRSRDALAVHYAAAMIAALAHVWVYRRQYHILRRNADLVETTVRAYSLWRTRRSDRNIPASANAESSTFVP